jgi:hypothetical protein
MDGGLKLGGVVIGRRLHSEDKRGFGTNLSEPEEMTSKQRKGVFDS